MHVNPVAQSYKQQVEGEDKRLLEPGELKTCRPSTLINRCLIAPSRDSPYFFKIILFDLQVDRMTRKITEIELWVVIIVRLDCFACKILS